MPRFDSQLSIVPARNPFSDLGKISAGVCHVRIDIVLIDSFIPAGGDNSHICITLDHLP